jgi:hypothetical protein
MVIYACKFCEKEFPSHHALECHVSRESLKKPEDRCGLKVERKRKKAQRVKLYFLYGCALNFIFCMDAR